MDTALAEDSVRRDDVAAAFQYLENDQTFQTCTHMGKCTYLLWLAFRFISIKIITKIITLYPNICLPCDDSPLIYVIERVEVQHRHKVLEIMLNCGINVDQHVPQNHPSLWLAIISQESTIEMINLLIKHGADIHYKCNDKTLLMLAAEYNRTDYMQILLDNGLNINEIYNNHNVLTHALGHNIYLVQASTIKWILTKHINVNAIKISPQMNIQIVDIEILIALCDANIDISNIKILPTLLKKLMEYQTNNVMRAILPLDICQMLNLYI